MLGLKPDSEEYKLKSTFAAYVLNTMFGFVSKQGLHYKILIHHKLDLSPLRKEKKKNP